MLIPAILPFLGNKGDGRLQIMFQIIIGYTKPSETLFERRLCHKENILSSTQLTPQP